MGRRVWYSDGDVWALDGEEGPTLEGQDGSVFRGEVVERPWIDRLPELALWGLVIGATVYALVRFRGPWRLPWAALLAVEAWLLARGLGP